MDSITSAYRVNVAYHGVDRLVIHFLAVAEQGGVTRAAKTLNITQPALTRSIRLLEEHLGVSLFDRHASGVEPTVYGRMLARRARLMQLEFDHALSEIEAFAQGREGKISIGAVPAWETIYIPDAISAAREELANVGFTIVGGSSRPLLAALRDGTIDLACVALELEPHPEIIAEPLINMERVVVCKSDHPLASRKSVSAVDLLEYSWSHMKGDEITLSRLGSYFSAYGLAPPTIEVECESNVSLLSILKSTELLGTAPKPIAEHSSFEGLVILPIQGSLWQYKSGIAYRREPPPTAFFSSFLSYLRSSLPQTN